MPNILMLDLTKYLEGGLVDVFQLDGMKGFLPAQLWVILYKRYN